MIKVVNRSIKSQNPDNSIIINIMRPSVLGNPFTTGTRDERIDKYRVHLWREIKAGNIRILKELERIRVATTLEDTVYLMCCCKPLRCHGDVIKSCVEWMIKQKGA
jgi:hypothetical protein